MRIETREQPDEVPKTKSAHFVTAIVVAAAILLALGFYKQQKSWSEGKPVALLNSIMLDDFYCRYHRWPTDVSEILSFSNGQIPDKTIEHIRLEVTTRSDALFEAQVWFDEPLGGTYQISRAADSITCHPDSGRDGLIKM